MLEASLYRPSGEDAYYEPITVAPGTKSTSVFMSFEPVISALSAACNPQNTRCEIKVYRFKNRGITYMPGTFDLSKETVVGVRTAEVTEGDGVELPIGEDLILTARHFTQGSSELPNLFYK